MHHTGTQFIGRVTGVPQGGTGELMNQIVSSGDEAVLEVELSPQELQALAQTSAPQPDTQKTAAAQSRCLPCVSVGAGAASVVAVVAMFLMHRSPSAEIERQPVVAAPISTPSPIVAVAAPPPRPQPAIAPPVKFANPFDRSEVFEFPAGTSRAEARERVAQILFERGQERHPKLRRVASIHRGV